MSKLAPFSQPKSKGPSLLKKFLANSKGSITPLFGLAAIPFVLAAGAAIDMSRVNREQSAFYNALDSAALAIAADDRSAMEGLTKSQQEQRRVKLEKYAQKYINANYKDISGGDAEIDVKLKVTGSEIKIDATLEFPMTFMQLAGIDSMTLKESTTVRKAMRPIELAMVLDTTGSMANDMAGLKTAANKLLATLYSDSTTKNMQSEFIRVSLVPFSAAVRLDPNAYDFSLNWIDTTGANPLSTYNFGGAGAPLNNFTAWSTLKKNASQYHTWNGCVEARKFGTGAANYITSDIAPNAADPETLFPAFFAPDSPSWYNTGGYSRYYVDAGGTLRNNANWNNQFIGAYADYGTAANTNLNAPSGSAQTGYDDSTIGNVGAENLNGPTNRRFFNPKKYVNKVIGEETFTPSGNGWNINAGPWDNCTASSVVPMTYKRANIEAGITAMKAAGNTNIAEGLAWGMRTISPGAPFTKVEGAPGIANDVIAPYNGPRWQKILVLMSDGENNASPGSYTDTGTSYGALGMTTVSLGSGLNRYNSNSGSSSTITGIMDGYTTSLCTKLKAEGVTIYSIGFRLDSPILKGCASSPSHYKYATSITDLVTYFDHIGADVLNKMIYVAN